MNIQKVISQLNKRYPGKQIIENRNMNGDVVEIICKIDPTEKHPTHSLAVAVVDQSVLQFHRKLTETYKVLKGKLIVFMTDRNVRLKKGGQLTIEPGEVHATFGEETWLTVYSEPGWTLKDHIGLKPIIKRYLVTINRQALGS